VQQEQAGKRGNRLNQAWAAGGSGRDAGGLRFAV